MYKYIYIYYIHLSYSLDCREGLAFQETRLNKFHMRRSQRRYSLEPASETFIEFPNELCFLVMSWQKADYVRWLWIFLVTLIISYSVHWERFPEWQTAQLMYWKMYFTGFSGVFLWNVLLWNFCYVIKM